MRVFKKSYIGDVRFSEIKDATQDEDFSRRLGYLTDENIVRTYISDYMYFYRTAVCDSQVKKFKQGLRKTKRVVYYYNKNDSKEYIYSPSRSRDFKQLSNLLTILQPGDILAFDGHVVVLYDFKYDSNGNKIDALLFESRGRSNKTLTRISEDSYYNLLFFKE